MEPARGQATMSFDAAEESIIPGPDSYPPTPTDDRLRITDTNLSLVVNDVGQTISQIQSQAQELGGYLVNSHQNTPEFGSSGSITVRVPSDSRTQFLNTVKGYAVKVASESVSGRDVTDQYQDLEARLQILEQTQTKFQSILDQATEVSDLLQAQRELVNIQSQIDAITGQQLYLERSAQLDRVTVYLSTDELALPLSPEQSWRPQVVFKQATRSLIQTARSGANSLIWLGVYSVILIPGAAILFFGYRFTHRNRQ